MHFENPYLLILLLLLPLIGWWYYRRQEKHYPTLRFSTLAGIGQTKSLKGQFRAGLPVFRAISIGLLIVAMARPQATLKEEDITAEGIDIVLVIDLSSSMLARDFEPDRLEASKKVAMDFVEKREYDRIGLVVFAGEAFTQCPLTTDHKVVLEFLANLECGLLQDGTAIGDGLATSVNRLKDSESKSKVVILLTDGVNNSGYIQPLTAAEIAKELNIKTYTIGVGSTGSALAPIGRRGDGQYLFGYAAVEIDEALLEEVATMTGGKYFRAVDETSLSNIYSEIDELEKTKIEVTTIKRYSEEFHYWVKWALFFLFLEFLLKNTILKSIP